MCHLVSVESHASRLAQDRNYFLGITNHKGRGRSLDCGFQNIMQKYNPCPSIHPFVHPSIHPSIQGNDIEGCVEEMWPYRWPSQYYSLQLHTSAACDHFLRIITKETGPNGQSKSALFTLTHGATVVGGLGVEGFVFIVTTDRLRR